MVTLTKSLIKEGQAFISVGRNRLKQYDKNTVYLENGKEFELELFNQKTTKVLVKIKMNGNYISSSGVVLKPGQRVFLERYLDEAKKFKFDTYSVENSKESAEAIAKNGLIEIEFYDEYVNVPYIYLNGTTNIYNSGTGGNSTGGNPNLWDTTNINTTYTSGSDVNCSYNVGASSFNVASMDSMSFCDTGENLRSFAPKQNNLKNSVASTKSVETGRVEKGSTSNQSFTYDSSTYNFCVSNIVTWKIIPTSQKPYDAEELTKNYCVSCGKKLTKSTWRFCPGCGEKI